MRERWLLSGPFSPPRHVGRGWGWLVLGLALVLGGLGAIDHAGSWNDGSRLATIEALVDYHSWCIDRSIFIQVPADHSRPGPYRQDDDLLNRHGTLDKLFINGHYYSDKSPVPALVLAAQYLLWQKTLGLVAREHPDRFCWLLTLGSSGLAFGLAVWCAYRLGRPLGLPLRHQLLLAAGLAVCTVAWAYTRQVNNHILLLAVALAVLVEMAWLAQGWHFQTSWRLLGLGSLAGLGYTIDLGAGPILFGLTWLAVAARCRRLSSVAWFTAAALPWLGLHHVLNYAVGGTWKPANAVVEYFLWPGCPFNQQTLTGGWHHGGFGQFLLYALALLFGKRGFLLHNLPLLLAFSGAVLLLRRRLVEKVEVLLALGWCGGVWLIYAIASTNASGECCSIRWFVPLLAPGFFLLAVLLREWPELEQVYLLLSGWGLILGALMAWYGPWIRHMVPLYWPVVAGALLSWGFLVLVQGWPTPQVGQRITLPEQPERRRAA